MLGLPTQAVQLSRAILVGAAPQELAITAPRFSSRPHGVRGLRRILLPMHS